MKLLLGDSPIISANVTAMIEKQGSPGSVKIQVRDNGAGMLLNICKNILFLFICKWCLYF